VKRVLHVHAVVDVGEGGPELAPDRVRHFFRNELQRLTEGMSRAERARHDIERLGELFFEAPEAAPALDLQLQNRCPRQHRAEQQTDARIAREQHDQHERRDGEGRHEKHHAVRRHRASALFDEIGEPIHAGQVVQPLLQWRQLAQGALAQKRHAFRLGSIERAVHTRAQAPRGARIAADRRHDDRRHQQEDRDEDHCNKDKLVG
jgi:hypothetical protein